MHGTVEKTIEAIEKTIAWRRDRNMYDIDAFAKEVEDEVSTYRHGTSGPGCSGGLRAAVAVAIPKRPKAQLRPLFMRG